MEKENVLDEGNVLEVEQETKPFEKIEEQELTFVNIKVRTDDKAEFIKQIRFTLEGEKEDITHKPKEFMEEIVKVRGLETHKESTKLLSMDKIPEKVFEMNNIIQEKGKVNVKASYTLMTTETEEGRKQYKFFNATQFDELEIL